MITTTGALGAHTGDANPATGWRTLISLLAGLALGACAASPPVAPAATAATATAAPAAAQSPGANPAPADKLATLQAWARNSGYRPYSKDGKTVWCKNEALLGSHLTRPRCVPEEALADVQRQSIESQQSLSERERICSGGSCNNSH